MTSFFPRLRGKRRGQRAEGARGFNESDTVTVSMARRFRKDEQRSQHFARTLRKQMTDAEVILWSYLRCGLLSGLRFRRQHPIGPYIADFACVAARLVWRSMAIRIFQRMKQHTIATVTPIYATEAGTCFA